jgi:phage protein
MKKQELIKHIEDLPYKEGPIVDKIDISRKGLLELVKQLDEPQKPVVPQFVADWYEKHKYALEFNIFDYVYRFEQKAKNDFKDWFDDINTKAIQILVNMHQFGYEVEKEKKYKITLLNRNDGDLYLVNQNADLANKYGHFSPVVLLFTKCTNFSKKCYELTKKDVVSYDFGWVFDCPGVQIEEVKDE